MPITRTRTSDPRGADVSRAGRRSAAVGLGLARRGLPATRDPRSPPVSWDGLPIPAQLYVALIITAGVAALVAFFPHELPHPVSFAVLLAVACLASAWKVNLPVPLASGVTLSVSYAVCLMALLLLGPEQAVLITAGSVLTQCGYGQAASLYRTVFSTAVAVLTMAATSLVFERLGGTIAVFESAAAIVGAIATYFVVNTSLIAGAIALSTGKGFLSIWRHDLLWLGASFMVAGGAGALAAGVLASDQHWTAVLLAAPLYLIYRTYQLFSERLEEQKRHTEEVQVLHREAVVALAQARAAERALGAEKERLAQALADMTRLEEARKQLLEREQAARASAEDANRLKDEFLAVVSHELRTPLNAILGWVYMLRRGKLDAALTVRAWETIYTSAQRQAALVEDLLDVARITSGTLRFDRSRVDLRAVVRDALELVQPGAATKGVRVTLETDPSNVDIHGDPARLQQIASNLIANAVKFTPAGGTVLVTLGRTDDDTAALVVTDTGQGISPEFLPLVFDPFRQADASTTRAHSGLGLGLSIVRNLVEAHGGTVIVESEGEGRGATFIVRLPVMAAAGAPESGASGGAPGLPESADAPDALEGLSVLVVDDDDPTREMIAAQLHERHATVLTAASAGRALEVLRGHHVDVLLADIGMPGEDGYSLIRKLRASDAPALASIPAAALTAFAREQDRQQAMRAGFHLHLAKPVDAGTLVAAVADLSRLHPVAATHLSSVQQ